ncbi:S-layer homology domain-containing protein [Tepidibacter aestuarii]|uniref:S-layer homology domain-containing protein n=1 Tax=Tepidibacter aestuarii TaxID=2925782 RepID=UPI0020C013D5|nr:S-layer homology domain-containing protein [Tepidibacter aestuarii]
MKNTKKVLSVALAGALAFGSMGAAFAAMPADVKGTDYETAVERLSGLNVLNGYEDGTFKPEKTITRAEFAAVVVRSLGLDDSAKASMGATGFGDVPANHWASGYINIASGLKVINGKAEGVFDPEAPVKYEEAVTMIVRALGYEPAAKAKGGYPNGYLVVAGQEDITDDVDGTIGTSAPRGIVAQLVDNSLEVNMMVQVGYGDEAKFVKSGTDGTDKETLLDTKLDVAFEEDIVDFTSSQKDDNKIEVGSKEIEVKDGFNFEGLKGVKIKAYYNDDDELVSYEVKDDVYFDAIEVDEDGDDLEIKLVGMDKTYTVSEDKRDLFTSIEDGDNFEYAKVIVEDGDVVGLDAITSMDGYILVEDVEKDVISGHDEEVDLEDYVVMKDGKEIKVSDIEEGDVVFYNDSKELAEVYTKTVTGKVEDVLTDEFTIDGEEYNYEGAFYLDEDSEKSTTELEDKVADMEGEKTTIHVNRQGDVILIDVNEDSENTSKIVGFLKDGAIKQYENRGETYYAVDIINKDGKEVSYDVEVDDDVIDGDETVTNGKVDDITGLVELEIDEDGEIKEIVVLENDTDNDIDVEDDNYAAGYKLSDDVLVFNVEKYDYADTDADDVEISTWEDADFDKVTDAVVYAKDGKAKYILVKDADNDSEESTTERALITEVKKVSGEDELRIKAYVGGDEKTFYTDTNERLDISDAGFDMDAAEALVGKVVELEVDNDSGKVVNTDLDALSTTTVASDATVKVSAKEIIDGDTTYRLISGAKVFNVTDASDVTVESVSDIDLDEYNVELVLDEAGTTFVKYVLLTDIAVADQADVDADKAALTIEGDLDNVTADLTLETSGSNGSTIAWASSDETVVATNGTVTRPASGEANATVTLTATIEKGDVTETKEFTVTVIALP